ncbi:MAG: TolB family protein [Dehalococcoidia bacterium]
MTLFAWLLIAPSNVGTNEVVFGPDISNVRSIAYTIPGAQFDDIVVQPADGSTAPRVIATVPSGGPTGAHVRGAASPLGDTIALLWVSPFAVRANLSLVDTSSGEVRQVDGQFDALSEVAWSADGRRVALISTGESDGAKRTKVIEVDTTTLLSIPVAEFEGAIQVAPVGYSFDSSRLYIVVVDARGSNLYEQSAGKSQLVAELSPGRTRDWALSPDGSRLAFIDVLGGGARNYIGRTMVIATGTITTQPAEKNQIGASWVPGSPLPAFGGPGGAWQLTDPAPDAAYLVPEDWSPDGHYLVATVYASSSDGSGPPQSALELIKREPVSGESARLRFSEAQGAAFLGWVRDLN